MLALVYGFKVLDPGYNFRRCFLISEFRIILMFNDGLVYHRTLTPSPYTPPTYTYPPHTPYVLFRPTYLPTYLFTMLFGRLPHFHRRFGGVLFWLLPIVPFFFASLLLVISAGLLRMKD